MGGKKYDSAATKRNVVKNRVAWARKNQNSNALDCMSKGRNGKTPPHMPAALVAMNMA